jgi:uroporphyrinogen decarboxylase
MMRQAGRVLPEYRALKEKHSFLDLATKPSLCAEVTVQPVDRLGVDAAILFSDILLPVASMGIGLTFDPGPILERAYDPARGVRSLRVPDPAEDYAFLARCVRATLERLQGRVPLIGFAGAPFTVAAYLLEGGSSKNFANTRRFLYSDDEGFLELLFFLADRTIDWLHVQVAAGISALQLFDSWAGILSPFAMERFALPAARRVFEGLELPKGFPTIYFAPGAGSLDAQARVGSSVLGLDWRVPMSEARARFPGRPLQGNLDPGALLGSAEEIRRRVREVLEGAGPNGGHIFNLGHGILPETPLENAELVVRFVHELSMERNA